MALLDSLTEQMKLERITRRNIEKQGQRSKVNGNYILDLQYGQFAYVDQGCSEAAATLSLWPKIGVK